MKGLKSLLILSTIIFSCVNLHAQIINVPEKAKKNFWDKYPDAKRVDWKNNVTRYSAKFQLGEEWYKANYNVDGGWEYTEKSIKLEEFPEAVKTSVKNSRFAGWKIISTAFVENDKSEQLYRVEFKSGIERKFVFFDADGKEIKTTSTI